MNLLVSNFSGDSGRVASCVAKSIVVGYPHSRGWSSSLKGGWHGIFSKPVRAPARTGALHHWCHQ